MMDKPGATLFIGILNFQFSRTMHVFYKFLFTPDFNQSRHRLNFKNSLSTSFLDYNWIVFCFGCCFWVYFCSFSFQRNGMAPSLPRDFWLVGVWWRTCMNFACVDTIEMNVCQLCIILQSILCPDVHFFFRPFELI